LPNYCKITLSGPCRARDVHACIFNEVLRLQYVFVVTAVSFMKLIQAFLVGRRACSVRSRSRL